MIKRRTFGLFAAGTALAAPSIVRAQTVLKVGLIPSEGFRARCSRRARTSSTPSRRTPG